MSKQVEPFAGDVKTLFPGEAVPLDDQGNFAVVYPVAFAKIREYTGALYRAIMETYFGNVPKDGNGEPDMDKIKQDMTDRLPELAPRFATAMWDLVREHCRPDPDLLPPDFVVPVSMAFVKVNFLNETRRKNWLAAAETLLEKVAGRRISISETISSSLLPLVTALRKYFAPGSMIAGGTPSLTVDGASDSSGTGSTGQLPSSQTREDSRLKTA